MGYTGSVSFAFDLCYLLEPYLTTGECPRNFNFDVTGQFIVAGNQNTNTLVSLKIDSATGKLQVVDQVECCSPNYVFAMRYDPVTAMPVF